MLVPRPNIIGAYQKYCVVGSLGLFGLLGTWPSTLNHQELLTALDSGI